MTITESRAHTFVVRMHRSPNGEHQRPPTWRGEILHVPSQQSISFLGLASVPEAIARLIGMVERGAGEPELDH